MSAFLIPSVPTSHLSKMQMQQRTAQQYSCSSSSSSSNNTIGYAIPSPVYTISNNCPSGSNNG